MTVQQLTICAHAAENLIFSELYPGNAWYGKKLIDKKIETQFDHLKRHFKMDIFELLPTAIQVEWFNTSRRLFIDGKEISPIVSQKFRNHSPDGFAVGYGGSGCAQAALAIMIHFLPHWAALEYYQDFKWMMVAKWPQKDFSQTINLKAIIIDIVQRRVNDPVK